jgi:two-component system response regulator FixJ
MPGMDGLALIHRLNEIGCHMPVIVITGHGDVPLAVRAMRAGVVDFIEKPFTSASILTSIRQCLDLSERAAARETEYESIKRRKDRLTERESQVMNQLVLGKSNKEIALILQISPRTVEVYRTNIMSKMQANSLAELVRTNIKLFGLEVHQAS